MAAAPPRWALLAFWGLLGVVLAARIMAVFTENVNWDEFALLHRAAASARTGDLVYGGRPGLGTLVLLPFADACRSAVDALVQARVLWTLMVVASAALFWLLLRAVLGPSPHRWFALATSLGLWVLAPQFLRFSVQVRTDQPGILFGLLGGLALVASRGHVRWAPLAGAAFAVGFLFTQKLLYVAGLVGILAIGQLLILGQWRLRREATRAALTAGTFLLVVLGYRQVMASLGTAPAMLPLEGQLTEFAFYRERFGWSQYRAMAPSLLPQLAVPLAGLLGLTAAWLLARGRHGGELATAWLVMLAGLVVVLFHAGRFPYFYMVLGLFPATIAGLVLGPVLERLRRPRLGLALLAAIWLPLSLAGLRQAAVITTERQWPQRESLAFVERNFPPDARGFQAHGAFACRADPDPFRILFPQNVARLDGPQGEESARALLQEFRNRPVQFMIEPHEPYPPPFREFWATRYVPYHASVLVPGRLVRGGAGAMVPFEVLVPGEYAWYPAPGSAASIVVGGGTVHPGQRVALATPGVYGVELPTGGEGMLVLALPEPPSSQAVPFYRFW
jgi:hypothetical protein